MEEKSSKNPEFDSYVELLFDLHNKEKDEDEANEVRDLMDKMWYSLQEDEQQELRGLMADLSWAWYGPPPRGRNPDDVLQDDLIRLAQCAKENKLNSEELSLMRKCYPVMPPETIAYRRGRVWALRKYYKIAFIFFECAQKHNPNNPTYPVMALQYLNEFDPDAANERAHKAVEQAQEANLGELVQSIAILMSTPDIPSQSNLQKFAKASEIAISKLLSHTQSEQVPSLLATVCLLGAICYRLTDEKIRAQKLFEIGAKLGSGHNRELLINILLKNPNRENAAEIFGYLKNQNLIPMAA
jgi:tetratricopeptide (TPR) repeat protein